MPTEKDLARRGQPQEAEIVDSQPEAIVQSDAGESQIGGLSFRSPEAMVNRAQQISKVLADIVNQRSLFNTINGKKFVRVEGWTTLGAMLGIVPEEESVEEKMDGSFVATVRLRLLKDGREVGRGSAECGMDEDRWSKANRYARRSMAVTRATGKAFRLAYSWIMVMAGYEPTPAEEMHEAPDLNGKSRTAPSASGFINDKQRAKFFHHAHEVGWKDDEIKKTLLSKFGIEDGSAAKIPAERFSEILNFFASGGLPKKE